jgi:hypothetical protein
MEDKPIPLLDDPHERRKRYGVKWKPWGGNGELLWWDPMSPEDYSYQVEAYNIEAYNEEKGSPS